MIILKKLGGIRLSALVALCAATLMLISLLLPYVATPGGFNPRSAPGSEAEEVDVSSFSMLDLTLHLKNELFVTPEQEVMSWIFVVLLALTALFCLLAMLFPLMDRATPTAIFALAAYAPFYLYSLDITQRGWVGNTAEGALTYVWGIGYYLFHVGLVIAVFGAVWLFVDRYREKRAPQQEKPVEEEKTEEEPETV